MWQVRPTGGLQREGVGVRKAVSPADQVNRRASRPVLSSQRKPEPASVKGQLERPDKPVVVNRRQVLQGGLWGLFSLSGLKAASAPAQASPVMEDLPEIPEDIPIETLKPLSQEALRKSAQAIEQVRPHLFPFEQRLLSRLQSLQEKANDLVVETQTLKRQGQNPRRVIEREAQKAMRGDSQAQAVLDYLREHFSTER